MTTTADDHSNSDYSKNLRRICSRHLALPPSCMEFSPRDASTSATSSVKLNEYFVVGTYHLQSTEAADSVPLPDGDDEGPAPPIKPQERDGSLNLFRIREETLTLIEKIPFPAGILDLHFIPGRSIFAVASSVGTISLYALTSRGSQGQSAELVINHLATHQAFPKADLVLSITWIPTTTANVPMLLATLNTGEIYLVKFSGWDFVSFTLANDELPLFTHGAEAWTSAICPTLEHVYTGGDDIQLRILDANLGELTQSPTTDIFVTESFKPKGHDAGITAILPLPFLHKRMFLTGSYDDHIRLFDVLPSGQAKLVSETFLGGGVWRLKFLEDHPNVAAHEGIVKFRVLASCMHAGAKMIEIAYGEEATGWKIDEVAWNTEHKSMNYASDVQPLLTANIGDGMVDGDEKRMCVSTSFYDKLLVLWEYDPRVSPT